MARSFLGGEFAGGESAWWRGNWIPQIVPASWWYERKWWYERSGEKHSTTSRVSPHFLSALAAS